MKDPLKMAGQALAGAYGIGINFTKFDENIERMLMRRGQRFARQINETTYNDLRRVLVDLMVEGGLNERELRNNINNVMSLTKRQRAETIARTEVFSAINESTNQTFKDNGIQKKKWLAAFDERTRPAHAAASGQIVKTEEPFNVGGDRLMYPGDPSGSPENIINCRCTLIPVME
jgi:SPP1 gp7 family putative phage head morphogenesis protein